MGWKGPVLAAIGAAAVAGIAIGLAIGDRDSHSAHGSGRAPSSSAAGTTEVAGTSTTVVGTTTTGTGATSKGITVPQPPRVRLRLGHPLLVGTVDDAFKQDDPAVAAGLAKVSADAGFDSVLLSSTWKGSTAPSASERAVLGNAIKAADAAGLEVFVFVWHGLNRGTPKTAAARRRFAAYTAALARGFPRVRNIVVGNEPNLNTFWLPQFGPHGSDAAANGYLDLLAKTYDALKAVSPGIRVIGGALAPRGADRPNLKRDTHSPSRFIEDLGAAYRASGRTKPVMDAIAMHPYMRTSAFPPTDVHAGSTTITIADYAKLVALLRRAFAGTAQPGAGLPVYYTEFGVQTRVPPAHRAAYTDLGSPAALDAVDAQTQARYYREALSIAACQPTVRGLFIFHTFDEPDLNGWQSGLYYADQKPKPSLRAFRSAAADARKASLTHCAGTMFVQKK